MTILPDGRVTICCGDNKNIGIIGDVTKDSPMSIWLSDKYQQWREFHANDEMHRIPLCKNCRTGRVTCRVFGNADLNQGFQP